jgi:cytochrome P450 family 307 subfamily A
LPVPVPGNQLDFLYYDGLGPLSQLFKIFFCLYLALAFCNWSQVQKTRRALARRFCHSSVYSDLADSALHKASNWFSKQLHAKCAGQGGRIPELKQLINQASANAFFGFFCTQTFEEPGDAEFVQMVRLFDEIFYEINQNHPTDVLPFLSPFFRSHLKNLAGMGTGIREFVVDRIINPHL